MATTTKAKLCPTQQCKPWLPITVVAVPPGGHCTLHLQICMNIHLLTAPCQHSRTAAANSMLASAHNSIYSCELVYAAAVPLLTARSALLQHDHILIGPTAKARKSCLTQSSMVSRAINPANPCQSNVPRRPAALSSWSQASRALHRYSTGSRKGSTPFSCEYANTADT